MKKIPLLAFIMRSLVLLKNWPDFVLYMYYFQRFMYENVFEDFVHKTVLDISLDCS